MYLLIGASVAVFFFAAFTGAPANAGARGPMAGGRHSQPDSCDAYDLIEEEAARARERVHQQLARLGC